MSEVCHDATHEPLQRGRLVWQSRVVTSSLLSLQGNGMNPTPHIHKLRVRYADTDRMDMVYHGTYAAYLEAARVEMLRDVGWVYATMEEDGVLLPVVRLELNYRKPARYDQELEVYTLVEGQPTSTLVLRCEVKHRGQVLVQGRVVLVFVDSKTGRPRRPPAGLVEALASNGRIDSGE